MSIYSNELNPNNEMKSIGSIRYTRRREVHWLM